MITCKEIDLNNGSQCDIMMNILSAYSEDAMGGGEPLPEYTVNNLPSELRKRSIAHVFIAELDGQPAGLATTFEGFSTFACKPLLNIHDMCVLPQYRRKGVCATLLMYIEHYAKEQGHCKLTLEVLEGNHPAKQAYTQAGFAPYELDPAAGQAFFWQKKI